MLHGAFAFHFFHSYHILNRIASTQCLFYGKANSILRIVIVHATSLLILRQGQSLRQDKFSARPSPFTKTFNYIPFRMNKMAKFVTSIIIKNENQRIINSEKRSRVRKKVFMRTESISNVSDTIELKGRARNSTFLPSSFLHANNHNVASTTKTTFFISPHSYYMNVPLKAYYTTYHFQGFRPHPHTQTLFALPCRNDRSRLLSARRNDNRLATSLRP